MIVTATGFTLAQAQTEVPPQPRTVFIIMMENQNWSLIYENPVAPYINSLLLTGAHAENYYNPPGVHPSEPNYLWLEAGTDFGIIDDYDPAINHQSSTAHLTTLLDAAGISWKSYAEGIGGQQCPLSSFDHFGAKHVPVLFFDDVTDVNDRHSANCIAHVRPYSELADDLASGNVARYNFITPDTCDDMHDNFGCPNENPIRNGDEWLSNELPPILNSPEYQNGGVVFITWDEATWGDGPIGMIVLSPDAKPGYSNAIPYTHSSTLRTLQEIFGVQPFLGDAANATDLSDLFARFP
jgi:phosphatidylinositol-3-phosphatase